MQLTCSKVGILGQVEKSNTFHMTRAKQPLKELNNALKLVKRKKEIIASFLFAKSQRK